MYGTVLALGAMVLMACVHRGSGEEVEGANAEIALEVESHNWSDIVIYLVKGSSTERLGTVGALSTETFVFPFRRLGYRRRRPAPCRPHRRPGILHQREPERAARPVDQVDAGERPVEVVSGGVLRDGGTA